MIKSFIVLILAGAPCLAQVANTPAVVHSDTGKAVVIPSQPVVIPGFMRVPPPVIVASAPDKPASIVVLGNFGTGSSSQRAVAAAMEAYHAKHPFSAGITVGNNFYPRGLPAPTSVRWKRDFEDLYGNMGIKFFPVFGIYDWNGDSPASEITYSYFSHAWNMPAEFYSFLSGAAQFFAVNTNDLSDKQLAWLDTALAASTAKWKVVYGSNPPYASQKEGSSDPSILAKLWPVMAKRGVSMYFAGYSGSMQHLKATNGIEVFVNGAGGQGLAALDADDPRGIFLAREYGFSVIDLTSDMITVRFVNTDGQELYSTSISKRRSE